MWLTQQKKLSKEKKNHLLHNQNMLPRTISLEKDHFLMKNFDLGKKFQSKL